jgi:hypothetical protein
LPGSRCPGWGATARLKVSDGAPPSVKRKPHPSDARTKPERSEARTSIDLSSLGRPDHDRRGSHFPREKPARPARAAFRRGLDARLFRLSPFPPDSDEIIETHALAGERLPNSRPIAVCMNHTRRESVKMKALVCALARFPYMRALNRS